VIFHSGKELNMTDVQRVQVDLAAVLSTALELGDAVPKGPLYLALDSDIDRWELVETCLLRAELAKVTAETISLTEKGQALARKCAEIFNKAASAGVKEAV
jgi:hypothetical protein